MEMARNEALDTGMDSPATTVARPRKMSMPPRVVTKPGTPT